MLIWASSFPKSLFPLSSGHWINYCAFSNVTYPGICVLSWTLSHGLSSSLLKCWKGLVVLWGHWDWTVLFVIWYTGPSFGPLGGWFLQTLLAAAKCSSVVLLRDNESQSYTEFLLLHFLSKILTLLEIRCLTSLGSGFSSPCLRSFSYFCSYLNMILEWKLQRRPV